MQRTAGIEVPNAALVARLNDLAEELADAMPDKLVIAGGPRRGKSRLTDRLKAGRLVYGSDALIGLGWSEASLAASRWLDEPGPWICEGVAMPRALRKWLARNPGSAKPCAQVVWLGEPVVATVDGQDAMAKGCLTVWREIRPELFRKGVRIRELNG